VLALREFPWMNGEVRGDSLVVKRYYNIGTAVGRDDKGLIVPNLKDCDRKPIVQIAGEPTGRLVGKAAVGSYWATALARIPDLHFELLAVMHGIDSVVLHYRRAGGQLTAEVFFFNSAGLVTRACANYES